MQSHERQYYETQGFVEWLCLFLISNLLAIIPTLTPKNTVMLKIKPYFPYAYQHNDGPISWFNVKSKKYLNSSAQDLTHIAMPNLLMVLMLV